MAIAAITGHVGGDIYTSDGVVVVVMMVVVVVVAVATVVVR
jgi:hypothetical protein